MCITHVRVQVPPRAPRRSKLCIACSDFFKVRARSRRCSSFPNRNRLRWVAIWIRRCAADLSRFKNIDFNRPFQNKRQLLSQLPFVLGSGRRRRPPPFGISMLRAAKPHLRRGVVLLLINLKRKISILAPPSTEKSLEAQGFSDFSFLFFHPAAIHPAAMLSVCLF